MIFESHAHYDDKQFDEDRDEILKELPNKGIEYVVNVGADLDSSQKSVALSEKYDYIYAAVGVHPHDALSIDESIIQRIDTLAEHKKVIAIGEIGLDYYYDNSPQTIQKLWFERQIELAKEKKLPIIVHSREAAKDTMDIVKGTHADKVGGVIHCFSYSYEIAKEYVDMGFYIGIGGVITFKNSKKSKEVVKGIPLKSLLLETDCPYLAPVPYRGKRNHSAYLDLVAKEIADIKGVEYDEVIKITRENGIKLFDVK
ncbi:TatD DNase family protein [Natranaerovirga pectinivora]|uniref:TatD DNase family protein n=1 Tax=Natranaerovirga pectinivora TaxID=682400 RepID=A0A4V2UZK8_9FIRM|nr:TatD family hydrolase [Natranaerovirga pectinivora]TCT11668.1 TatD DNase family protein [Natranaerovirga pectinivora]